MTIKQELGVNHLITGLSVFVIGLLIMLGVPIYITMLTYGATVALLGLCDLITD